MNKTILLCSFAVLALGSVTATAQNKPEGERLVQDAMCYACHQLESASLGPPWRAIAARHATRREVMTPVLASKIIRGGGGNWGNVPMVPNQRVSTREASIMAKWILEQAQ